MSQHPRTLFSALRGKAKTGILLEGIGLGFVVLVGYMAFTFALDRTLRLETVYRACLLVVLVAAIWNVLRKSVFRPIKFELTDDELALALERGEDLQQGLISAVQFERVIDKGSDHRESTEMMQHVVTDVYGRVNQIRNQAALDVGRTRKFGGILALCLVAIGTWGALDAASLGLWAKRNLLLSDEDWPRASALAFAVDATDGVIRVPEGNDVMIEVHASGVIPDQVFVDLEFPDGSDVRYPMLLSGGEEETKGRFTYLLESVITNVTVHAVGGDAARQTLEVQMVTRPAIQELTIEKTFPAYMKQDKEKVKGSEGDMRLPAGVELAFSGKVSKELENAYFTFGDDKKVDFTVDKATSTFRGTFKPEKSGVLTIDVTDVDGLGAHKPPKIFVRVVKDAAPIVEFKTAGIGSMIVYKAVIPGTLKIRDDFGLIKVVSKVKITGGMAEGGPKPEEIPWETKEFEGMRQPNVEENEVEYEERVAFDLLKNGNDLNKDPKDPSQKIRPGMLLAIQFDSVDNFGPGDPHTGQSEVLTLRVVDEEKLMQDLHRRQLERRRELTQILDKEKSYKSEIEEIVSPTSSDKRAKLARLRLRAIARDQRALQKQILGVANRYKQILDEYFNNRILKPSQVTKQRQGIQLPLEKLSKEDFPTSAQEVDDFAHQGLEDQRTVAVASYSAIIKVMEQVISNMRHLESVAGILEDVKRVRDMERQVEVDSKKALNKEDKADEVKKKDDKSKTGDTKKKDGK